MFKRVAALLAALSSPAAAQTTDTQGWVNLTAMGPVSGKLIYFAEVQPRFNDDASRLSQLLLRPAIGVQLSPAITLYQGYVRVVLPIANGPDRHEDRSFQQVGWLIGRGIGGELSSRSRLEQRWLSNGRDVGWRAREMLRYELPLSARKKSVAFLTSAEGFWALNTTDWGARKGFDQVRLFGGAEIPLAGKSTIEAGYLAQIVDGGATPTRVNHVASVALFFRR